MLLNILYNTEYLTRCAGNLRKEPSVHGLHKLAEWTMKPTVTQATEIEALLFLDLLCGIACPLCCECLTVVSRPLGHSWRHCCLYDTFYIDSYIFSLPDSAFAAFLRGSCALQIALIIIIIISDNVWSKNSRTQELSWSEDPLRPQSLNPTSHYNSISKLRNTPQNENTELASNSSALETTEQRSSKI